MDEHLLKRATDIGARFALDGTPHTTERLGRGSINDTFLVTTAGGKRYVLQKLSPIFAPSVLEDIAALTHAMKQCGFTTTELVPTKSSELGVVANNECWRMLTHIPGRTVEEGVTAEEARSAMELIGKFHQMFANHEHRFRHVREGFHDTQKIMTGLKETIAEYHGTEKNVLLAETGRAILDEYGSRPHAWAHLPKRIIHGDPKLNNIRFAADSHEAIALLDLDTLGRGSVVIDIADAARSWCNRADEGDEGNAMFDCDIFRAMMEGYASTANFLTEAEREAIPRAIAQITLELAARFTTDAYREAYFKFDREHYTDLSTQNFTKARTQFALYRDVFKKINAIGLLVP